MAKLATVKVKWTPSPSEDIVSRTLVISKPTGETTVELDKLATEGEFKIVAPAQVSVTTVVKDEDGLTAVSEVLIVKISDLVVPLPDTNLTFQVTNVEDVPEPESSSSHPATP